jgi:hypothetical protein
LDPRFRRKSEKPEQSGLARIESIQVYSISPLQHYDSCPHSQKKNASSNGASFLETLAKTIQQKKRKV